ncbi:MAG TPA: hypothetical protein PLE72_06420 [Azospira sp.]|nr:hypothetical protein [Azospira sp.]HNN08018.1 hypothetical protein [Azospira sp.]
MRKLSLLILVAISAASFPAAAQYAPPGDQNILYGVKKNQMPQGMVVEQGAANPGIPTSGTQQAQQLKKNQPGYGNPGYGYPGYGGGPTTIYRDRKHGTSVYTGPNGTTVCRDINGNVTVCN